MHQLLHSIFCKQEGIDMKKTIHMNTAASGQQAVKHHCNELYSAKKALNVS